MVLGCFTANAQEVTRPYRYFATQQVHAQLLEQDGGFSANLEAMEQFIRDYGDAGNDRSDTISVIFHILFREGTAYPGLDQINAVVEALNHDFGAYDGPIEPYQSGQLQAYAEQAQNPSISFCMAAGGGITGPVEFVQTNISEWTIDNDMKSSLLGGADPLDPTNYLNVWVCNLEDNLAGFSQMPGGPTGTDGIVIDYDFLPNFVQDTLYPYKKGKTLSHLVGHYLGLYELWSDEYPCTDDHVADTPIHNAPNFEMPAPDVRHIAFCPDGPVDEMLMNFMDNTDDASQNLFTLGQKSRMKAVLSENGPRAALRTAVTACSGQYLGGNEIGLRGSTTTSEDGENRLQIYPNPTRGNITLKIKANAGAADISIYNGYGARMMETTCTLDKQRQSLKLKCEGWSPGLYFVEVRFSDGTKLNSAFAIAG